MTLVVVNQGEEAFMDAILGVNYTLHLFTNDVTETGSTADALTEEDLTEATFTGYAAKALTGGSWTTTPGDPTTGLYAMQAFTASADTSPQTVYGYYVTKTADGALVWYEEFSSSVTVQNDGDSIRVTPRLTLNDTQDEES